MRRESFWVWALAISLLAAGCQEALVPMPSPVEPPPAGPSKLKPSSPAAPVPSPPKIASIGIEELFMRKGEGALLMVDVRPELFYAMGHIDGAINLPLKSFLADYPEKKPALDAAVAAGRSIVVYCGNEKCPDAKAMARSLARRGYESAVYEGGWDEWKSAGLE